MQKIEHLLNNTGSNFQASKFTPDHVDERIDNFLDWFLKEKLKDMSEDEFQASIMSQKADRQFNLSFICRATCTPW